jgi:hypothetical protein
MTIVPLMSTWSAPTSKAVFHLRCPAGPPELRESFGLARSEVNRIAAVLAEHVALLCREWERIHGGL